MKTHDREQGKKHLHEKEREREKAREFQTGDRGDYMRFQEWLRSDEGEDWIFDLKKRARPLLKIDLKVQDLLGEQDLI